MTVFKSRINNEEFDDCLLAVSGITILEVAIGHFGHDDFYVIGPSPIVTNDVNNPVVGEIPQSEEFPNAIVTNIVAQPE
jgi:hypothetical protein